VFSLSIVILAEQHKYYRWLKQGVKNIVDVIIENFRECTNILFRVNSVIRHE